MTGERSLKIDEDLKGRRKLEEGEKRAGRRRYLSVSSQDRIGNQRKFPIVCRKYINS